jgi:hypothetical protein
MTPIVPHPGRQFQPPLGAKLGLIEKHHSDAVEGVDLFDIQVVFGRAHVALMHAAALPNRQTHVGFAGVGPLAHDLGRRQAGGRIVHFVLHHGEEGLSVVLSFAIITCQGENFLDTLVHPRFAGAYLADAGQQLVKMIGQTAAALEPFVVQGETFDNVLAQSRRGPLPEPGRHRGLDPIADRDDHVEVVMLDCTPDFPSPLRSNY